MQLVVGLLVFAKQIPQEWHSVSNQSFASYTGYIKKQVWNKQEKK